MRSMPVTKLHPITSMPRFSFAAALLVMLLVPGTHASAQRVIPGQLSAISRVDLSEDFGRVERYNQFVDAANAVRVARSRHQNRAAIYGLLTVASVALAATQYMEFQRRLDTGDGSGSEIPAAIFALSLGGVVGAGVLTIDHLGDSRELDKQEARLLAGMRALFPERDPKQPMVAPGASR